MVNKKLFKFLIFALSFILLANISLAEEFKVNKITYTILNFYKCQDGETRLNSEQFSSFTKSVENDPILSKKFNVWGDGSLAIKSFDFFNDGGNVFLRNTSRFKIKFDEKSIAYISLNPDYWFVTYDLDFSEEDFNLGQRLNSLVLKNNAGVREYVRNGLYKFSCGEQLGILIYNVYDYNGSIECLNADRDIYDCLNDDNYNKMTQKLDFSKIDKKEDRIHEPFYNQKIIMDKRHLGNDIENTVTRMIILSNIKIMDYGIIHYTTYEGLIEYLLNLRKMPQIINNLNRLDDESENLLIESQNLLSEFRGYFFPWQINKLVINNISKEIIIYNSEINTLSSTPKIIKSKLDIDNNFYINYYSKFSNFYLQKFDLVSESVTLKIKEVNSIITSMWDLKEDKQQVFASYFFGLFGLIIAFFAVVIPLYIEKKNNIKFEELKHNLNNIVGILTNINGTLKSKNKLHKAKKRK